MHSFNQACTRSLAHPFVDSFVCPMNPFIHSIMNPSFHTFTHSINDPLHIHSPTHASSHSFIHSSIHSLFPSFIHSLIRPSMHAYIMRQLRKAWWARPADRASRTNQADWPSRTFVEIRWSRPITSVGSLILDRLV